MSLYKNISKFYDQIFPLKETKKEFIKSLKKTAAGKALEIGCANGEVSFYLEQLGYKPVGIDLNTDLINLADKKKNKINSDADFIELNMLDLNKTFEKGSFELATCFGNTLVHLNDNFEIKNFALSIFELLNKDGVFVIQIVNYDRVITDKVTSLPIIETADIKFTRKYSILSNLQINFETELLIKPVKKTFSDSTMLYPLRQTELAEILKSAGFTTEFFGSFSKEPFKSSSPALICVSKKMNNM